MRMYCKVRTIHAVSDNNRSCPVNFMKHIYTFRVNEGTWNVQEGGLCTFHCVLSTFAELRRESPCTVMSLCPSVRPHGITRLPLDGFS